MKKYKMILAYDGTTYGGWQKQLTTTSIQQTLEENLSKVIRSTITVIGAGRTDAGVHASGQVAHFTSPEISPTLIQNSLNHMMYKRIIIKNFEEVPLEFHSRFSALKKEYHYHVWLDRAPCPFLNPYRWHVGSRLSIPAIQESLELLLGSHNFLGFANSGRTYLNTTRELTKASFQEQEGGFRLEFEGNGFLYKMARNMVGILIEIGKNKLSPQIITEILQTPLHKQNKPTAPAKGLFLHKITY